MSEPVVLRPGRATLADWRAIYRGAPLALDPIARADVEAGAAALEAILAKAPAPARTGRGSPTVSELLQRGGDPLPAGLVRLFVALKIAALGQGLSGVRWTLVQSLADCLAHDLLPAIQARQVSDRLALSHLFALITGTGETLGDNRRRAAAKGLKKAGLFPVKLSAPEKQALLSGTELSTAFALAGLFEAERVFQSALVAGALSAEAARLPGAILHPRVHQLSRQPGQNEVARTLRALLGIGPGEAARAGDESPPEIAESRRFTPRMGACLDLLRQAAETLARAGNAASEAHVVLWQTGELVAGLEDTSSVTFAADQIALALRELGSLGERRIGVLSANAGAVSGPVMQMIAAGFSTEIRERAYPSGFESEAEPDYPLVSAPGAPRLLRVAGAASLVVVVELLAAARACDRADCPSPGEALGKVRGLLREAAPQVNGETGISPADLAGAAELVRSGAVALAAGVDLPSVGPALPS